MKRFVAVASLLLIGTLAFTRTPATAQSTATVFYAESYHHGDARVVEESFDAKLTAQDAEYRERIRDSHGTERYMFSITPRRPEGANDILAWLVKLTDLRHPALYENVLQTTQGLSDDVHNNLWRLEPGRYAAVPVEAKRIIKVEDFYVVLQVKAHHFTPPESEHLDSMTVAVEFTNTDPRGSSGSQNAGTPQK
jgi:hypothetical protein